MGLGVLDVKSTTHVPGTAAIEDLDELNVARKNTSGNVKYSASGIILVPQPSDDPNDPLNLPLWRRDLLTGVLCLWSVIASTLSPLLAADSIDLLFYYKPSQTFTGIALLTGYHLLGVGVAGFIFVASARVWGKRHLYLLGTFIIIISSIWGGASGQNYKSMVAARFFQGVGLAPFEALVNASVGDLYFVHERGLRMAVSNLCLFGGAFFTPVIVGTIAYNPALKWQWTFYFIAIFGAVLFPLVVLFVPETAYRRDDRTVELSQSTDNAVESKEALTSTELPSTPESTTAYQPPTPPGLISRRTLAVFTGRKTDEPFWKLLLRPFPLFFHPAVFWGMLIQGTLIGWTVFIGIIVAAIYFSPPVNLTEQQTGYLYTGAFLGALIGFAIAGLLSYIPVWMAKRNRGIYEPEFRLILVIPMLIFGCAGLFGFGMTARGHGLIVPDVFFALEVIGMVLGAVASALYIVDAHKDIAVEAFTCLLIFKNIFSFALTFKGYDWLIQADIEPLFTKLGGVQVAICCTTIFLYIFGKWNRAFFARHDILKMTGLR
ncbi:hypothetical protein AMS68_005395 [Peltaster fructicola]|uniref:Major facilitator superfamily (MFS) profile domain-containing protein n=1 Tax=Peltaster fructicola TaxID=286661 RepID=A0A6H0XZ54_9PEZI|nr:hypothetical protein AMS68_005395 [Peltaster fructicola]